MGSRYETIYYPLLGALRLIIVPAILIWLIGQLMAFEWWRPSAVSLTLLGLALLINQLALVTFAARMRSVLWLFGIGIDRLAALRIHLQSMFYFFILPMTVGLEIARFLKIRVINPSASVSGLSGALLLDRMLGAASALALAVVCLPFVNLSVRFDLLPTVIWLCLAGIALLTCAILLWPGVRRLLLKAWRLTKGRRLALIGLFVLSVLMHALFSWAVQLTGRSLGLPITFGDTCFAVAGGMLLVAIPVSLAGLGPAEAGAVALFAALGYDLPVAIAAGALPYFLRLVGAVEGGIWEFAEGGASALEATRRSIKQRGLPQGF